MDCINRLGESGTKTTFSHINGLCGTHSDFPITASIVFALSNNTDSLAVQTSSTAQIITGVVWTHYGLGKHSETLTPSDALKGFKILWADYFLFGLCISSIKISALLFYTRVFNNVRRFKIVLRAALIVIALWFLAYLFIILFNCTPIHKFWDREVPGTCLDLYAWYMACVLIDTLLDLMVLLLPMPIIFNIHCKPSRKVAIFFAFFFGYL